VNVDTLERVQAIIAGTLSTPLETVRHDAKASDLPSWDSLRHLVLVMEIERAFEVQFAIEEIAELDSVQKIVSALETRRAS
jgi:acyl carrier protein